MVTSLASALTQRKVKANLAMTGETTSLERVLPGGIREKILAAKRAGIKDIILCEENRRTSMKSSRCTHRNDFHYGSIIWGCLGLALDRREGGRCHGLFTIKEDKNKEKPCTMKLNYNMSDQIEWLRWSDLQQTTSRLRPLSSCRWAHCMAVGASFTS